MALTTKEEATLKVIAAKEDLEKAVQAVIDTANSQTATKHAEIKAIEDKRNTDIKALRDA